jgi:hypothetical protein
MRRLLHGLDQVERALISAIEPFPRQKPRTRSSAGDREIGRLRAPAGPDRACNLQLSTSAFVIAIGEERLREAERDGSSS